MHLHLDPIGGVAGDMFIAAVADTFPHLADGLLDAVRRAGAPADVRGRLVAHRDHALAGRRFEVDEPPAGAKGALYAFRRDQHSHVSFKEIRDRLQASSLADGVKRHAIGIFTVLAQAEARAHGHEVENVSFHEVGAWDSVADVTGAAYLIDSLGDASWSCSALPTGNGLVRCAHGLLPVPAPATASLLEGFVLRNDGLDGERVTPTGAAILRHLGCRNGLDGRPRRLAGSGIGFGTRVLPGISNVLRVLAFEETPAEPLREEVAVIAFEVDDQASEDLAEGLARLRSMPGVLDVVQVPAFGKKGRMVAQVQVVARAGDEETVARGCFAQTSTLGVRWHRVGRWALPRTTTTVAVEGRAIRVKLAARPDGEETAKAEMEDLAAAGSTHREREALREAAESKAKAQARGQGRHRD